MKAKLLSAISALILSASISSASAEPYMPAYITDMLVNVCTHAQDDKPRALDSTLRHHDISRQQAVEQVVCNGKALVNFARSANAEKVVAMLEPYERRAKGKVSISDVAAP